MAETTLNNAGYDEWDFPLEVSDDSLGFNDKETAISEDTGSIKDVLQRQENLSFLQNYFSSLFDGAAGLKLSLRNDAGESVANEIIGYEKKVLNVTGVEENIPLTSQSGEGEIGVSFSVDIVTGQKEHKLKVYGVLGSNDILKNIDVKI